MVDKPKKIADQLMRVGRQAKQGMTLGFSDELEDAIAAGILASSDKDIGYAQALKMARELSKSELAQDWQEAPVTSFASQLAGGLPLAATRPLKAASDWVRGGSALQGAGKGAAVGAALGGISGAGAAEDTLSDRLFGFGTGAAIGGALGGATAPLARMGGDQTGVDFRKVTKQTAKGFENKAEQELARQLAARPDLPEQLASAESVFQQSQRTGIPLTLAETLAQSPNDPLLAQQAVLGTNPMTAGQMAQMYAARSGTPQQAGQIEQQLMNVARQLDPSVGSYDEAARALIETAGNKQRDITQSLVRQANPLYEQAYQQSASPDVLANPLIANVVKQVKSDPVFAQEIGNAPEYSLRVLDVAKRQLDDMANKAAISGGRNEARLIGQARDQLLQAMDQASPEYAQARGIYSGNPDMLRMREQLGGLADIDPNDVRSVDRALFSGTQQNAQTTAQALGEKAPTAAAARIYNAMDVTRGDPATLGGKLAPDSRTLEMLQQYAGNNQPLAETIDVINRAKLGERMRYGSPTQPRMEAERGLETAANAAIDVATGGKTTLLRRVAGMFGRNDPQSDPQFYKDMAELMTTERGMDLLRRVAQGQQNAIQELNTIGLPSLVARSTAQTTAIPTMIVAPSAVMAPQMPQNRDDFSDIDAILNVKKQDNFEDIDKILQGIR